MIAELTLIVALLQSPTVTVVFTDRTVTMTVVDVEKQLKTALKENDTALAAALTAALGTQPARPRCITWEQHLAEVKSWWAAPERVYVDCSDPKVGPPKG